MDTYRVKRLKKSGRFSTYSIESKDTADSTPYNEAQIINLNEFSDNCAVVADFILNKMHEVKSGFQLEDLFNNIKWEDAINYAITSHKKRNPDTDVTTPKYKCVLDTLPDNLANDLRLVYAL